MSDKKISELIASTTPLAGTEVLPIVQSGVTKKVSIANLTAGRSLSADTFTATSTDTSGAVIQVNTSATTQGRIGGSTSMIYLANTQHIFFNGATEVGRFNSSNNLALATGNLVIGTSGKGIDFSADGSAAGMTSELLDDYEEGTYDASLYEDGGAVLDSVTGYYTKIGNVVTIHVQSLGGTTGTGGVVRSNLPFTSAHYASNTLAYSNSNGSAVACFAINGGTYLEFVDTIGAIASGNKMIGSDISASSRTYFSLTYITSD